VASWSPQWLAYSSYDGVLVTAAEMNALPAAVRTALSQYVECGGALVVVGAWQPPDAWRRSRRELGTLTTYYAGFGQCLVQAEADHHKWTPAQGGQTAWAWFQTGLPFRPMRSVTDANSAFPVVENLSVPVRGLFILMVVFAVVLGPLNLYVL